MRVDLTPTTELTEAERQELRELATRVHGARELRRDAATRLVWGGIDDTVSAVRVRLGGLLVSSLFVAERGILVDGRRTHAGGVRGMVTHPEYRRRGLGRAAMQRATRFMWQDLRADLGLLLSSEMAVPFYASLR